MQNNSKKRQASSISNRSVIEKTVFLPDLGKLPPQAIELEEAVLGAILNESKSLEKIELSVDDFYKKDNQIIYSAILNLKNKHKPVDLLTVVEELSAMKQLEAVGGAVHVAELTEKVASAAHIEFHAAILQQKSIARKLIIQSQNVISKSYDESEDVQDTLEYLEKSFTEIRSGGVSSDYFDMPSAIQKTLNYLASIQTKREKGESVSITTGMNTLDNQFNGGWSAPDLIILGGRPSMGKTQFAIHFAKSASQSGSHCLFISIEMTMIQLIMRILIEDERINFYNMKTGQLKEEEWLFIDEKIREMQSDKLFIADDYNVRNLNNIKSLARKLHRIGKLDIMIIDYLQLIKTNLAFGTRDIEVGYITGELKNLAKELNIPIILLAQLSRPPKGTKIQIPVLADLRESGNIEQDADKVIFPHRPTYYEPEAEDKNGRSWKNRGVLIIGKDREGVKDEKVYFRTDDRFKKIYDDYAYVPITTKTTNTLPVEENAELPF